MIEKMEIPEQILVTLGIQGPHYERTGEQRENVEPFFMLNDGSRVSADGLYDHLFEVKRTLGIFLFRRRIELMNARLDSSNLDAARGES